MADAKISALTNLTAADPTNDMIPIVDVSDTPPASGNTKRISINNILSSSPTASGALTVTGLVTAGSATISGDLTVRTNKLFVNATGVGVGTTTILSDFVVQNSSNCRFEITSQADGIAIENLNNARNAYLNMTMFADAYIWNRLGSEAMRLNSTGLGVGVVPYVSWPATSKALQLGASSAIEGRTNDGSRTSLYTNAVWNGTNLIYQNTAAASYYLQSSSVHSWYTAPSGTAGNNITFTQAMTLDASGRLLVGTANASVTSETGCRLLLNNGAVGHFTIAITTNQSTAATSCYDFYSTSAAAYRFYVTSAGVINATNTTISAISDARLKENVQDIDVGLGAILALKPRKFDWKAGKGKDIKGDRGFIAQEFEQVFPQLVDEWKDPAPEGEAPYKSVRQDLIPVLVKAIQELTARVQTLEAK